MSLLDQSVREISHRIRSGEVSPLQVVDAHIERIEQVNPKLNALACDRFAAARAEARQAGDRLAREGAAAVPPLLGVPFTVKEFLAVTGLPQTGGLVRRKHHIASEDATVVARLREAGAICLGVTNAAEAGLWSETKNRVYGRTNNPWDLGRTPGGSSGGSGALVAAGGVPFDLGADVGGSIRIPAALCGTVGHKPTGRLVPNSGQFPGGSGEVNAYLTVGPLARKVEDLMPLLRVIAGPDGHDPVARPMALGVPEEVDLKGLRVIVLPRHGRTRVSGPVSGAVEQAAAVLAERGARLETWDSPKLRKSFDMWTGALSSEPGNSYRELVGARRRDLLGELIRYPVGRSRHQSMVLALLLTEPLVGKLQGRHRRYANLAKTLRTELDAVLGDDGVLLHPAYARTAPRHHDMIRTPFDFVYTALFNVLEYPGTVVPTGFDSRGLPLSVQVLAPRGADHRTIAAARAIEAGLGGWVRAEP
ncbi:MAG: amidase [Deltaproteobacteria bacterium]|nr:MAG: amidase [Deltaproteobacteria bacterium]